MAEAPPDKQVGGSEAPPLSVKEFFETVPGRAVRVNKMGTAEAGTYGTIYRLSLQFLQLHCETPSCNGVRFFESANADTLTPGRRHETFITYSCRNCGRSFKTYACWADLSKDGVNGSIFKYGEHPPFGPPTPARLISLVGPEKDY